MEIIKKILLKIIKFFDKIIIVPITRIIVFLNDFISENSKIIEKWLNKTSSLVFISLTFAIVAFFIVNTESTRLLENSATVLYDQPVNVTYNEEAYVIEGLPEKVDITLIGKSSNLYLAKQIGVGDISLDLSGLKPGSHKVNLKYTESIKTIKYKLDPSTATIIIHPKVSEVKTLSYDLLNQDKLDSKLLIDNIKLKRDDVIIKGSKEQIGNVATVKALIDINQYNINDKGEYTLNNMPLLAYDEKGNTVNVEIVPNKIDAVIKVSSPNKEVPIKVMPKGKLAFGKAISSLIIDETTVKIYGALEDLEDIEYVPIEIDVEGLGGPKEYNVSIEKPLGIKHMSVTNATINVNIEDETSREINGVQITPKGLKEGLVVQATTEEDREITVIVNGVSKVIEKIDATMITATIDLTNLEEGKHEVEVEVKGNDLKVDYIAKTKKINVTIQKQN